MGLEMIEQIGTPMLLIPVRNGRKQVFQVIFGEKVAGDHRAILPGGRSVLIEVKTIHDRNLVWSDLRDHQPDKLKEHESFGGLSLLVWVHAPDVYVMRFPIEGFGAGKGITPERATDIHRQTAEYLRGCLEGVR
jgi:hypothetical protein